MSLIIENTDGTQCWLNEQGQVHRTDGPAVEWSDGGKSWYEYDTLHRTDGPAVEYPNGGCHWYIRGTELTEGEFLLLSFVTL